MPRSSAISLMFTNRLGATTSSFIKESRSVPPASTSASFQSLPNNLTACSLVAGLAYSNARLVASLLFQRRKHTVGCERPSRHTPSYSIGDGVGDSRSWRDGGRLAQSYHASLV